jgi:probable F420-dependent oxidoreductase
MKFGISMNMTWHGASPMDVARLTESLGFESMWMGEHIFIPAEVKDPKLHVVSAVPPEYKHMADPFIWLTAAAVATTRLRLGFNICLVPQRHPIHLAKQLACLDRISGGRVSFGAGAGWIEEEATVMGFAIKDRWKRTMEYIRAMKALWENETAGFEGEHVSFPPIYLYPKPVQQPRLPILIGSGGPGLNNRYALRRVAEHCDGWIPCFLTPAEMKAEMEVLRGMCAETGRDFDRMDISIVMPAANLGVGEMFDSAGALDGTPRDAKTLIADYEAAGCHRMVVGLVDLTHENYVPVLTTAARGLGLI